MHCSFQGYNFDIDGVQAYRGISMNKTMHDYSRRMKVSKCGQKRDPVITSDVLNDDDGLNLSLFHVMNGEKHF